jgi:hypothetical protein
MVFSYPLAENPFDLSGKQRIRGERKLNMLG